MTHFIHEQHTGGTLKYIKKTKTSNIILCVSFFETHIKITLRKFLIHLGGLMLLSMNEDFSMSKHDITYQPCTAMLEVFLLKVFFFIVIHLFPLKMLNLPTSGGSKY